MGKAKKSVEETPVTERAICRRSHDRVVTEPPPEVDPKAEKPIVHRYRIGLRKVVHGKKTKEDGKYDWTQLKGESAYQVTVRAAERWAPIHARHFEPRTLESRLVSKDIECLVFEDDKPEGLTNADVMRDSPIAQITRTVDGLTKLRKMLRGDSLVTVVEQIGADHPGMPLLRGILAEQQAALKWAEDKLEDLRRQVRTHVSEEEFEEILEAEEADDEPDDGYDDDDEEDEDDDG